MRFCGLASSKGSNFHFGFCRDSFYFPVLDVYEMNRTKTKKPCLNGKRLFQSYKILKIWIRRPSLSYPADLLTGCIKQNLCHVRFDFKAIISRSSFFANHQKWN